MQSALRLLPLHEFHLKMGAKIAPFAGWAMPLAYADCGVLDSARHTRSRASVFDVSHMLKVSVTGHDIAGKLEQKLLAAPVSGMAKGESRLTLFVNEQDGIIDDAIVTRINDGYRIVSNAGRADTVRAKYAKEELEFIDESGPMLAIQGPDAASIVEGIFGDFGLGSIFFMQATEIVWHGKKISLSRTGYTGEDGFELILPDPGTAEHFIRSALEKGARLAGLGARDILRIEAGLLLSGQDFDESRTPVEAGLLWTIGDRNRKFIGAETVRQRIAAKPQERIRGFIAANGPIPRHGAEIVDLDTDKCIGHVTSGAFSPTLDAVIAIGYASDTMASPNLGWRIRGQLHNGVKVARLPFVPHKYRKKPS
jgi:aminomethyltransferase